MSHKRQASTLVKVAQPLDIEIGNNHSVDAFGVDVNS